MARGLTANVLADILAGVVRLGFLTKLEYVSGNVHFWSGLGDLDWSGDTYTGAGDLGSINPVTETTELGQRELSMGLNGVPPSAIATAHNEEYRNRPVSLWFATFDTNWGIRSDPYLMFKGTLERQRIVDNINGPSLIRVTCLDSITDPNRPRELRWTDAHHRQRYPTDTAFRFVPDLQQDEIPWGRKSTNVSQPNANVPIRDTDF